MKYCENCHKKIDRGNRAMRCEKCQKMQRKKNVKKYNKRYGSARQTKEMFQWAKWVKTLDNDTVIALITIYRQRLKQNHFNTDDHNKYKTMIKILTKLYKEKKITTIKDTKEQIFQPEIVASNTVDVKWKYAESGWVNFYDDGIVTLNANLFFAWWFEGKIHTTKSLKTIYWTWRNGYIKR